MKFQITATFAVAAFLVFTPVGASAQQYYHSGPVPSYGRMVLATQVPNQQAQAAPVNYNPYQPAPMQPGPGYSPMPVNQMPPPVGYQPVQAMPMQQNMGYQPSPYVPVQQNMGYQYNAVIPAQPVTQYYQENSQPAGNQNFVSNPAQSGGNDYQSETSSPSPYEQQELALKESKMLRELENIKHSRDDSETFRQLDNFGFGEEGGQTSQQGYVSKSTSSGRIAGTLRGVGSIFKSGVRTLAPAATTVGTYFIIRSAN